MLVNIAHLLLLIVDTFHKELPHNQPWEIMLEEHQVLTFNVNKGPNRKKVMDLYARCQFLSAYCMQTFKEMFVIGFFDIDISIFGPNMASSTLKYVAYKDVEYGDLVHEDI